MSLFLQQVGAIFRKDLKTELRQGHNLLSIILFGVLLLLLFSFALSVDPDLMRRMAPGLFWLSIFFTSILSLSHSFRQETEEGQWEGLLLLGTDPRALYMGKFLTNLSYTLCLQLVMLPLMAVLFDQNLSFSLGLCLFLGSVGIASIGTLYAGLTASFREAQMLLPLLLFPMLVPVLLCAVNATSLSLAHDLFGQQRAWLKLLILFDTIFFLGSTLFAETLFDRV
ncbi:MAG: heme exporter protein CcmB [Deltaproteobacteria bacterium]|nr:heme exporter protein CcmB [Deltaproteobacteria bacterium]